MTISMHQVLEPGDSGSIPREGEKNYGFNPPDDIVLSSRFAAPVLFFRVNRERGSSAPDVLLTIRLNGDSTGTFRISGQARVHTFIEAFATGIHSGENRITFTVDREGITLSDIFMLYQRSE
jgi:hypothetical protein